MTLQVPRKHVTRADGTCLVCGLKSWQIFQQQGFQHCDGGVALKRKAEDAKLATVCRRMSR